MLSMLQMFYNVLTSGSVGVVIKLDSLCFFQATATRPTLLGMRSMLRQVGRSGSYPLFSSRKTKNDYIQLLPSCLTAEHAWSAPVGMLHKLQNTVRASFGVSTQVCWIKIYFSISIAQQPPPHLLVDGRKCRKASDLIWNRVSLFH